MIEFTNMELKQMKVALIQNKDILDSYNSLIASSEIMYKVNNITEVLEDSYLDMIIKVKDEEFEGLLDTINLCSLKFYKFMCENKGFQRYIEINKDKYYYIRNEDDKKDRPEPISYTRNIITLVLNEKSQFNATLYFERDKEYIDFIAPEIHHEDLVKYDNYVLEQWLWNFYKCGVFKYLKIVDIENTKNNHHTPNIDNDYETDNGVPFVDGTVYNDYKIIVESTITKKRFDLCTFSFSFYNCMDKEPFEYNDEDDYPIFDEIDTLNRRSLKILDCADFDNFSFGYDISNLSFSEKWLLYKNFFTRYIEENHPTYDYVYNLTTTNISLYNNFEETKQRIMSWGDIFDGKNSIQ